MAPRLLSFLNQIETALTNNDPERFQAPGERVVNYQKGIARLSLGPSLGSITLQCFTLAAGQICIKVQLAWTQAEGARMMAIYPQGKFDWFSEAYKVAEAWLGGPGKAESMPANEAAATSSALESFASA